MESNWKCCKYTVSHQTSPLLMYLFLPVRVHGFLFHSVGHLIIQWIICHFTIYFDIQIALDLASGSLLIPSLLSGTKDGPAYFILSLSIPGTSHLSKVPWFFIEKNCI